MNAPPLLLGAALLLWGWQCGLLWIGALLGLVLESSRLVSARWELTQADLDRIWNLCTVLFLGAFVVAFASSDGVNTVASLFAQANAAGRVAALGKSARWMLLVLQWMPLALAPIVIAQNFGQQTRMDWSTFSWWLRRMRGRNPVGDPAWQGGLNVTYPYFAATLTAASAANNGQPFFFAAISALLAWALWPRRPRGLPPTTWGAGLVVVIALGYGGQLGLVKLRKVLEQLDTALVSRFAGNQFDAKESRTALGSIGRLKLSGRIVMRVTAASNTPPSLLREASYNLFKAPVWAASRKDFANVVSERDGTTWLLSPRPRSPRSLAISTLLPGGEGVLPLPHGATRLEQLPVVLKTNRFGTVKAENGPGYVDFQAQYDDVSFDLRILVTLTLRIFRLFSTTHNLSIRGHGQWW